MNYDIGSNEMNYNIGSFRGREKPFNLEQQVCF